MVKYIHNNGEMGLICFQLQQRLRQTTTEVTGWLQTESCVYERKGVEHIHVPLVSASYSNHIDLSSIFRPSLPNWAISFIFQ